MYQSQSMHDHSHSAVWSGAPGYARMLRLYFKALYSPEDYAKLSWIYAGATNLRYEQLLAGTINNTLLNEPFTAQMPPSIPCVPMWETMGPILGIVGNVCRSSLRDPAAAAKLRTFLRALKRVVRDLQDNAAYGASALASFYNTTLAVGEGIYRGLWGVDGLSTTFCFDDDRLNNTEYIFGTDSGVAVPRDRWWVQDWGCER